MTAEEFGAYRGRMVREYAAEHVRAGDWSAADSEQRAEKETDDLLPDGVDTAGMVLLVGETTDGAVGFVWVGPEPGPRLGWWIYDIEVVPEHRRRGFGRALLEAAESEVKRRGGDSVGLNVFGGNAIARSLYESSGYDLTSLQMRKRLVP